MNQHHSHPDQHHHGQHPQHHKKGLHKSWRTWIFLIAVLAMLAAMVMYNQTDDEALPPGGAPRQPMPAAAP